MNMKVFKFSRNGKSYVVASKTNKEARSFLLKEYDIDIPNCFEIDKNKWEDKNIVMYVDNDIEKEKFYTSIMEQLPSSGVQLISSTETSLFGYNVNNRPLSTDT